MDFLFYIMAGALVGLAVGMTGVGGGSLMTPILLALGFPLHTAVGTDLLFAAMTKTGGAFVHGKLRTVRWDLVMLLAAGSIPASLLTILVLRYRFHGPEQYAGIITTTLGITLILTSMAILWRHKLAEIASHSEFVTNDRLAAAIPFVGALLGVLVTLSSVGAGAIATAVLMVFFPRLPSVRIVGTDISHAVPLTLIAGLGHLYLGNVDIELLLGLLLGSLPAVSIGARVAHYLPERFMRSILATTLCGIGIKFAFF